MFNLPASNRIAAFQDSCHCQLVFEPRQPDSKIPVDLNLLVQQVAELMEKDQLYSKCQ